jgi:hypothetical protein
LVQKMGRLWVLERLAGGAVLAVGLGINGALLCLLVHISLGLPVWSLYIVAGAVVVAMGVLAGTARAHTPPAARLAQLLDARAGSADLYASALEFQGHPQRFGWLGRATWAKAVAEAPSVRLRPRWPRTCRRHGLALTAQALVLVAATLLAAWFQSHRVSSPDLGAAPVAIVRRPSEGESTSEVTTPSKPPEAAAALPAAPLPMLEAETQPSDKPTEETVKITNEMIDQYLKEMPNQEDVDLTGVTPLRWDQEEASGKNGQQEQHPGEKIDPVRLDASLIKDLEVAKKTKEEGGGNKEGGVDIAVMGNQGDLKAKGNNGGKGDKESLADAVSKDPRGQPSRMAVPPQPLALAIRSVLRLPTRAKAEDRPLSPLDLSAGLERLKSQPQDAGTAPVKELAPPEDRVVRPEIVNDRDAALTRSYFDQLRKADR